MKCTSNGARYVPCEARSQEKEKKSGLYSLYSLLFFRDPFHIRPISEQTPTSASRSFQDSPPVPQHVPMATSYRHLLPATTSSLPPTSPPSPKPRNQTKVACSACRKRKSKVKNPERLLARTTDHFPIQQCTGERPVCSVCENKRTECLYDTEANTTRVASLKRKYSAVTGQVENLNFLLNYLKQGSEAEAAELVRRIRASDDVDATIQLVRDGSLLLSPAFAERSSTSSTPATTTWVPQDGGSNPRRVPHHTKPEMHGRRIREDVNWTSSSSGVSGSTGRTSSTGSMLNNLGGSSAQVYGPLDAS